MPSPRQPLHHWVIGDVHGCAESLRLLLRQLPGHDRLVFCGDLVNRGPHIAATMDLAWALVCAGRAVWLKGNHEADLLRALQRGDARSGQELAGNATYRQLGERRCRAWMERLARLPEVYWGDGWAATHAGFDPVTWEPQLRIRAPFWDAYDGRYGEVVVGHTPTPTPELQRIRPDIVLVDTGACYGGRLTAYCPETGQVRQAPGLPVWSRAEFQVLTARAERLQACAR